MRFNGRWTRCDDNIVRPIIRGEIQAGDGSWRAAEFLVDTGADRTVLSANVLGALHLRLDERVEQIGGVGGIVDSAVVETLIRLTREDDNKVVFRGRYAGCLEQDALDISVLGRDIMDLFAVIVDRRSDVVCLLGGQHGYRIHNK